MSRGAFFSGTVVYKIEVQQDESLLMKCRYYNNFCDMKDEDLIISKEDLHGIKDSLKRISHWQQSYHDHDSVMDGYGWTVAYDYGKDHYLYEGYHDRPEDYDEMMQLIQITIEEIIARYSAEYSESDAARRIKL